MPLLEHRLPNGLQIIGEHLPTARSAAIGFFVQTGARDETAAEAGVSHFLEHMLFKGTPRRSALDVNRDFDRVGAAYNAYTSEELTVFHAAMLPEYLAAVAEILADIMRPSLRQEDFDTEKQVILEEIGMYEDMPAFAASEHARRIYFAGHPLGNSVLGSRESISALSRAAMLEYFHRRYAPSNIVVALAGQFDWAAITDYLQRLCGEWTGPAATRGGLVPWSGAGGRHVVVKEGAAQEHVLVFSPGPAADDPGRYAAATLALAIGDDTGSRLYWKLVHEGRVESAACGIDQSMANGMVATTLSCDPQLASENLEIVHGILADVQQHGISPSELATAKNKIVSRLVRHAERPPGRMRAIAGSWIYNQEYHDLDRELARFDAVTLTSIRDVLDRFPLTQATSVAYGPLKTL